MCIAEKDVPAFKKRVACYLMELSLQKKRYCDAIYYYGIEKIKYEKINFEEIEQKYKDETKTWKKPTIPDITKVTPTISLEELEKKYKEESTSWKNTINLEELKCI
jgi:hypothetical protein